MNTDNDFYNAILARHSVRRYRQTRLNEKELSGVMDLSKVSETLENNQFSLKLFDYNPETQAGKALGGFGRIMKPPHFVAPCISGNHLSTVDLGFRTQHIVNALWRRGIGSCFVGCAHKQEQVKRLLELPDETRVISFVIFGFPENDQSLRLYQKVSQIFTKSKKRFSLEELFIDHQIPKIIKMDKQISKILEAGRAAPSATNAQPWRFGINNNHFIIYARQKIVANIFDLNQDYSLHDTGICMANMSQTAEALGTPLHWQMITTNTNAFIKSENDIPIAFFSLDDPRRSK